MLARHVLMTDPGEHEASDDHPGNSLGADEAHQRIFERADIEGIDPAQEHSDARHDATEFVLDPSPSLLQNGHALTPSGLMLK